MIQCGAVVFDTPEEPALGWAARAGETAFRIQGVEALDNRTVWLLNTDFQTMCRIGLAGHAFFRSDGFLRLKVGQILADWGCLGVDGVMLDPSTGASAVAGVFDRLVRLQCATLGVDRADWRPPRIAFRSAIRETLIPPDEVLESHLTNAAIEAGQSYTRCVTRQWTGQRLITHVARPRLEHALNVLQSPVPAATDYQPIRPPGRGTPLRDWFDGHPGPMLLRASVSGMDKELSDLVNLGSSAQSTHQSTGTGSTYSALSTRQWMTGDEARVYDQFGEVEVDEALWWPRWAQPVQAIPALGRFAECVEDYDHMGYSLGLFADQLWTGLTQNQSASAMDAKRVQNVIAPFLRASDRMGCLRSAIRFIQQGYAVTGFGAGRVGLRLDASEALPEAHRACATAGCVPPMAAPDPVAREGQGAMDADPIAEARLELLAGGMHSTFDAIDEEITQATAAALARAMAAGQN